MRLGNTQIEFEETDERLKITIPLKRSKPVLIIYSLLAAFWFGGLLLFVFILLRPARGGFVAGFPRSIQIMWIIGVIVWMYVWIRKIGRTILRWWQFYLAKRELLFIDKDTLIVRRPVSIFGLTDAYDRTYVSPFYYSEQHKALAFPYGNVRHILVAMSVDEPVQRQLLKFLNDRYFPNLDDNDDDDDDDE